MIGIPGGCGIISQASLKELWPVHGVQLSEGALLTILANGDSPLPDGVPPE